MQQKQIKLKVELKFDKRVTLTANFNLLQIRHICSWAAPVWGYEPAHEFSTTTFGLTAAAQLSVQHATSV